MASDLQRIAEGIHLQRQRMADARIGRVALVVVAQAFQLMAEIDRVMIAILRL